MIDTKHQILLLIFSDYDIEDMVKRNIIQTLNDQSFKDLTQQIYLILYELPFSRLYYLYSRKQIPHYITGIIKNQRKSPYLEYHKFFKVHENIIVDDIEIEDKEDEVINDNTMNKLEVINKVLYKNYPIKDIEKFTQEQMEEFFSIELYKLYLKKKTNGNYSFTRMSKDLNINRNLISDSIQQAKKIIRREYNKYDNKR